MNTSRKPFAIMLYLCCNLMAVIQLHGQQATQFTLATLQPIIYNAAVAGTQEAIIVQGGLRRQWLGLPGSPSAQWVQWQQPLSFIRGGIGFQYESSQIGVHQTSKAELSASRHFRFGKTSLLSLGLAANANQWTWDGNKMRTPNGNYELPSVNHQDPVLNNITIQGWAPGLQGGVWYQTEKIQAGLSIRQIIMSNLKYNDNFFAPTLLVTTYFATFAATFGSDEGIQIRPGVVLKRDRSSFQAELSTIFSYRQNIFAGLSFRGYTQDSRDALCFIAGWKLGNRTTVMYSYDYTLSSLRQVQDGTHELGLQYQLKSVNARGSLPPRIYNPRSL